MHDELSRELTLHFETEDDQKPQQQQQQQHPDQPADDEHDEHDDHSAQEDRKPYADSASPAPAAAVAMDVQQEGIAAA